MRALLVTAALFLLSGCTSPRIDSVWVECEDTQCRTCHGNGSRPCPECGGGPTAARCKKCEGKGVLVCPHGRIVEDESDEERGRAYLRVQAVLWKHPSDVEARKQLGAIYLGRARDAFRRAEERDEPGSGDKLDARWGEFRERARSGETKDSHAVARHWFDLAREYLGADEPTTSPAGVVAAPR